MSWSARAGRCTAADRRTASRSVKVDDNQNAFNHAQIRFFLVSSMTRVRAMGLRGRRAGFFVGSTSVRTISPSSKMVSTKR